MPARILSPPLKTEAGFKAASRMKRKRPRDRRGSAEPRLLREIRNTPAAINGADRRLARASEYFEHRGLADPVCSDQPGANRAETESKIIEKEAAIRQAIAELDRAQIIPHSFKPLQTKTVAAPRKDPPAATIRVVSDESA